MPDRIIRDELMRSRRFRRLPSDSHRLLYVYLLLSADPFGNLEADPENVGAILRRDLTDEEASGLLDPLVSADLIRPYEVGGKKLIHIPRYRQRLRFGKSRITRPPKSIEDPWIAKAIKNKQLDWKDSTQPVHDLDASRTVTGGIQAAPTDVDVDVDVNQKHGLPTHDIARAHEPQTEKSQTEKPKTVHNNFQNQNQTDPELPREWWKDDARTDAAGRALQLPAKAGESYPDYRTRLFALIATRNRGNAAPAAPAPVAPRAPPAAAPRVRQAPEQILQGILDAAKNQHRT